MAEWNSQKCPASGSTVVVRIRSMLGNPIYEVAEYDSGMWTLPNGSCIAKPDWILDWTPIPSFDLANPKV